MATMIVAIGTDRVQFTLTDDAFCTVETTDGEIYVGTVSVDRDVIRVDSNMQGRPTLLDADEVFAILAADATNPHLEPAGSPAEATTQSDVALAA